MNRSPHIISKVVENHTATLKMQFDETLSDFKGHFPGNPLLPGVSQIDYAIAMARQLLNVDAPFAGIEALKFQQPILPNQDVELALQWHPANQKLNFQFSSGLGTHSTGRVLLRSDASLTD
ncbi:hypothetical protein [Thaumasiovibrio subtropicus]|uniref:ApeI family dehydratase n=1 Tax=Thaumasiovibrio subtropicus TaxID=1891207 RepID=UPI000B358BED|nr:hypothetical protein [Thaumasiovibrio subtropicus]